jgi:DNase/tRNase domain of colicin-like bacteriocin
MLSCSIIPGVRDNGSGTRSGGCDYPLVAGWKALADAEIWVKHNYDIIALVAKQDNDVIRKNLVEFYTTTIKKNTPKDFNGPGIYNDVEYNKFGFPELREKNPLGNEYVFKKANGNHTTDFTDANKFLSENKSLLGYDEVWFKPGSTTFKVKKNGTWSELLSWHHHENGTDMIPVPTELHSKLSHVGGVQTVFLGINKLFNY